MSNRKQIKRPRSYLDKVMAAAVEVQPGTVGILKIAHDDWCPMLQDRRAECTCNPDVTLHPVPPRVAEDDGGG